MRFGVLLAGVEAERGVKGAEPTVGVGLASECDQLAMARPLGFRPRRAFAVERHVTLPPGGDRWTAAPHASRPTVCRGAPLPQFASTGNPRRYWRRAEPPPISP